MFYHFAILLLTSQLFVPATEDARIVNGNVSAPGRWPFMAAIRRKYSLNFKCGAAIFSSQYIITAAHCLDNKIDAEPVQVILGTTYIKHVNPANVYSIADYKIHDKYTGFPQPFNKSKKMNDIAIIQLTREIDFSKAGINVNCVCEPEPLDRLDTNNCIAIGWGRNGTGKLETPFNLHEVVVPILDCQNRTLNCQRTDPATIGVGNLAENKDICQGDSGGPLVCPLKEHPTVFSLVGVASLVNGVDCLDGKIREPSIFTLVLYFRDWLKKNAPDKVKKDPVKPTIASQSAPFFNLYSSLSVMLTLNLLILFI